MHSEGRQPAEANPMDRREDLSRRILRLAQTYVRVKAERRSGISWDSVKQRKVTDPETGRERLDPPKAFREAQESAANQAFLRARACRSRQDFVDFFTGTLCAVPQFLPREEYVAVSLALLDEGQWEDVKSLTMLALSTLSNNFSATAKE